MKKLFATMAVLLVAAMLTVACAPAPAPTPTNPVKTDASDVTEAPDVTVPPETTVPPTEPPTELKVPDRPIKLAGLKGPTSMGLAELITKAQQDDADIRVDFELFGSPNELVPKIVKGECDLAAVPANLASTLYNKTDGQVVTVAINTLGILNIVERGDTIHSLEDLKGKTIYASGQGAVPEYAFHLLLEKSGIDPDHDVEIIWEAEHSAVVQSLVAHDGAIALLPQPFVTVTQKKVEDLRVAIDLNTVWESLVEDAGFVMGVLVAQKSLVEAYPEMMDAFLERYEASIAFANDQPEEAAELIEALGIFKAAIAKEAIPYCSIRFADGQAMKTMLEGFLRLMFDANPQSIGGQLPGPEFYYGAD
ncbi:MAG: ABC transporter substrate-binding protein [Saccharofermentanales bacterium]